MKTFVPHELAPAICALLLLLLYAPTGYSFTILCCFYLHTNLSPLVAGACWSTCQFKQQQSTITRGLSSRSFVYWHMTRRRRRRRSCWTTFSHTRSCTCSTYRFKFVYIISLQCVQVFLSHTQTETETDGRVRQVNCERQWRGGCVSSFHFLGRICVPAVLFVARRLSVSIKLHCTAPHWVPWWWCSRLSKRLDDFYFLAFTFTLYGRGGRSQRVPRTTSFTLTTPFSLSYVSPL